MVDQVYERHVEKMVGHVLSFQQNSAFFGHIYKKVTSGVDALCFKMYTLLAILNENF